MYGFFDNFLCLFNIFLLCFIIVLVIGVLRFFIVFIDLIVLNGFFFFILFFIFGSSINIIFFNWLIV